MKLLLILLCIGYGTARAEVAFRIPPAEMLKTRFAQDCGGTSVDLQSEMPPVDNQQEAPWCSTFTAKALLEHYLHTQNTDANLLLYIKRISATDLNCRAVNTPDLGTGTATPNMVGGATVDQVLAGAQAAGKLYLESDWPFDHKMFDHGGVLARLTAYYTQKKMVKSQPACASCTSNTSPVAQLESEFKGVAEVVGQAANSEEFIQKLQSKKIVKDPGPQGANSSPVTLNPPFSIRSARFRNADTYMTEILSSLKEHRPLGISVCMTQLRQSEKFTKNPVLEQRRTECGEHAMTVIGARVANGQCQLHLRNSWGRDWPETSEKPDGTAWVSVDHLLKSLKVLRSGECEATSIVRPKDQKNPTGDNVVLDSTSNFKGNFDFQSGRWRDGLFEGQWDSTGTRYKGSIREGLFDGEGESTTVNRSSKGQFSKGYLMEGVTQGLWNSEKGIRFTGKVKESVAWDGQYSGYWNKETSYEGTIKNGRFNGEGKKTSVSGDFQRGVFKDGALVDGSYKDVWNIDEGVRFEGEVRGGMPLSGKMFDRSGKLIRAYP